jgi:hypothetical protein
VSTMEYSQCTTYNIITSIYMQGREKIEKAFTAIEADVRCSLRQEFF